MVGILQSTQFYFILILYNDYALFGSTFRLDQHGRISLMCGSGIQIKFSGLLLIFACENDLFGAHSNVHSFLIAYLVHFAINGNRTCSTDIDHTQFSSLAEILCTEFISGGQSDGAYRYCCSCNDSVDVAVHQLDLAGYEQILDQKLFSQTLCGIMLHISW